MGDTTTLVIVPLVVACGGTVVNMSGRGLGYISGTIDRLETLSGYIASKKISRWCGCDCVRRKTGGRALLPEMDSARELASLMVDIGNTLRRKVIALLIYCLTQIC